MDKVVFSIVNEQDERIFVGNTDEFIMFVHEHRNELKNWTKHVFIMRDETSVNPVDVFGLKDILVELQEMIKVTQLIRNMMNAGNN